MTDEQTSRLHRFLAELRRRHVVRVALGYAAVVFILLQLSEIVLPAFLVGPQADSVLRVVVVVTVLLFPIVLALAWLYEITPQGIRSMSALDAESGVPQVRTFMPRVALLVIAVMAGASGWWWWKAAEAGLDTGRRDGPVFQASMAEAGFGTIQSVAVLPFEDLSPESGNEYFGASMHEAVVDEMGQLAAVRVVSRTSMLNYDRAGKSLPQMGSELNVDALIEGSIRIIGDQVEIGVRLIHAGSEDQRWSERYARDMTDILGLQRDVAELIAREVSVMVGPGLDPTRSAALGEDDDPAIEPPSMSGPVETTVRPVLGSNSPSTAGVSPAAQRSYLEGRYRLAEGSQADVEDAREFFTVALEEDPDFVPALTGLAGSELLLGLDSEGPVRLERLVRSRQLAERALEQERDNQEAMEVMSAVEDALISSGLGATRAGAEVDLSESMMTMFSSIGEGIILLPDGDTLSLDKGMAPVITSMGELLHQRFLRSEDGWSWNDSTGSAERRGNSPNPFRNSLRLLNSGQIRAAIDLAEDGVDAGSTDWRLWELLEQLYRMDGDMDEILDLREERVASLGAEPGPDLPSLARAFEDGMEGYWRWKQAEYGRRRAAGEPVFETFVGAMEAGLGQSDAAFAALDTAARMAEPALASLRADPVWDDLRSSGRFRNLIRAMRVDLGRPGGRP